MPNSLPRYFALPPAEILALPVSELKPLRRELRRWRKRFTASEREFRSAFAARRHTIPEDDAQRVGHLLALGDAITEASATFLKNLDAIIARRKSGSSRIDRRAPRGSIAVRSTP